MQNKLAQTGYMDMSMKLVSVNNQFAFKLFSEIKKSVIYGNVMGSFAVERYGLDGLLRLKRSDITKRIKQYEKMTSFEEL